MIPSVRGRRTGRTGQDGAAAVELALVLPILVLLVFGIIEFGFIFNHWLTVTHGAREGVRVFSVDTEANAEDAGEAASNGTINDVTCDGTELSGGSSVQMTCTTDYKPFTPLMGTFVGDPVIISSTAQMRRE